MAQYHSTTHKIVFCIYDDGIGIYNTLRKSTHNPATELDAILLSVQEGVGDGKGQGNGLYGLYQVVHENKGTVTITSGGASIRLNDHGELGKYDRIPFLPGNRKGTTVDFQLDLNNRIDITRAFQSIGGYDCFDIRIDNMIDDEGFYVYNVLDNCQGDRNKGFWGKYKK